MSVALPLLTDLGATPHYSFQCELESVKYSFEFIWNDRDGAWYMQVGDGEENILAGSIRVILGLPLLGRFRDARLPPGQLLAVDTSNQDLDAGLEDLGSRVAIYYFTQAEVLANTGS